MNNVQQYSSFRSVEFSDQDSVLPLIPAVDGHWNVLVVDLDHQLVRPELVLGFRVWCEADAHSMVGWGRGGGYVQVCKLDGAFAQCKPSLGTEQNSKLCILHCVCVFIGMHIAHKNFDLCIFSSWWYIFPQKCTNNLPHCTTGSFSAH